MFNNYSRGTPMKYLILALLLFSAPVFATGNHKKCPDGYTGTYPNCVKPQPPTKDPNWWQENHNENTNSNAQGQGQAQGQHQGQTATGGTGVGVGVGGQGGRGGNGGAGGSVGDTSSSSVSHGGSSRSNATGGTSSSTATGGLSSSTVGDTNATGGYSGGNRLNNDSQSNSGASANGVVNVDTSDRSVTNVAGSRTNINTFIPGDLPSNAMTISPGAYITTAGDTDCGVLQTKIQVPVYQWNKKGTKKRQVGYDEDLAPVFDSNGVQIDYQTVYTGNGGYYLRGSHVTYVLSTQGGSNSSQLGLQGGGGGGYGGLSYGSGNSYSQGGAKIIIRSCIASRHEPKPVAPRTARRVATPRRKAKARRPAPVACVPRAARVCPAR